MLNLFFRHPETRLAGLPEPGSAATPGAARCREPGGRGCGGKSPKRRAVTKASLLVASSYVRSDALVPSSDAHCL